MSVERFLKSFLYLSRILGQNSCIINAITLKYFLMLQKIRKHGLPIGRPGSKAVPNISQSQWIEFGSCEVWRLT